MHNIKSYFNSLKKAQTFDTPINQIFEHVTLLFQVFVGIWSPTKNLDGDDWFDPCPSRFWYGSSVNNSS